MFNELTQYAGGACESSPTLGYMQKIASVPTLKERLKFAVQQAEDRLAAVKEARDIFDRNPDIERLLDLMQRGNF